MKTQVIFTNDYIDMESALKEDGCETTPDTVYEEIERWFEDECFNLDIDIENRLICVAELQRWNGRHSAYNFDIGKNISDCLKSLAWGGDETITFYVEDNELKAAKTGHDNPVNPSVFIFREVSDEKHLRELGDAWYCDSIEKYTILDLVTKPIGHYAVDFGK